MIHTEPPNRGLYSTNWTIVSKRIQCWADAIGASVYHLGNITVLACDEYDARQVLAANYCKKLKEVRRKISDLNDKIYDLEDELTEYEEEELKLIKQASAAESLFTRRTPDWIKNHMTFSFMKEVQE